MDDQQLEYVYRILGRGPGECIHREKLLWEHKHTHPKTDPIHYGQCLCLFWHLLSTKQYKHQVTQASETKYSWLRNEIEQVGF